MCFFTGRRHWSSLFNDVYSEQIAKWERHCENTDIDAEYLHAKCFFTGDIYDASSTIFAGDITKRTVTNIPQEVMTKMGETSRFLIKFNEDIGIVMKENTRSVLLVLDRSRRCECCTKRENGQTVWGNCVQHRESWVHCWNLQLWQC